MTNKFTIEDSVQKLEEIENDFMEEIIKKYYLLLTQSGIDKLLPENTLYFRDNRSDEEDIFCIPWKNCKK